VRSIALVCTIADVEALLSRVDRDGGMLLFAVDGKTDAFAVFECDPGAYRRREGAGGWVAGTNHRLRADGEGAPAEPLTSSQRRYRRLEALARRLCESTGAVEVPRDLIRLLADPGVEVRGEEYGTVYANVACPSQGVVWYTFGGYPAASTGKWRRWPWPWGRGGRRDRSPLT